jgi:hypothetical protein
MDNQRIIQSIPATFSFNFWTMNIVIAIDKVSTMRYPVPQVATLKTQLFYKLSS